MIRRHEIRISRGRLERRTRRLALRGWVLEPERQDAIEVGDADGLTETLSAWHESGRRSRFSRSRVVVDDSLVQYAVVPGLAGARTVRDFQVAACLRCEALFGWSEDRWVVAVATPPTTGPTLVCAARREDVAVWERTCRELKGLNPAVMPAAIDAIDNVRRRFADDARVAALSSDGAVGFLVQRGEVQAVVQERALACADWSDEIALEWLDAQAGLAEPWQQSSIAFILDLRDWGSGCVVRERRLQ